MRGRSAAARVSFLLLACCVILLSACDDSAAPSSRRKNNPPVAGASTADERKLAAAGHTGDAAILKTTTGPPALPKPTGPLPRDASCITGQCHASYKTSVKIHGPIAAGDCTLCHENDTGSHQYPLKRKGDATCTFCHSVTGTMPVEHKALTNGGCLACHRPHVSDGKFLLKAASVKELCTTCHAIVPGKHAHQPFLNGQCVVCHEPHQSDNQKLLRGGEGPNHCFTCHADLKQRITTQAVVHEPAKKACENCHRPHTSDSPHLLSRSLNDQCHTCHAKTAQIVKTAAVPHQPVTGGEGCANCHDAHASPNAALLQERQDKLCMKCHEKAIEGRDGNTIVAMGPVMLRKYLHGPVKQGNCAACHEVHGSGHDALLAADFPTSFYRPFKLDAYALCFRCHSKDLVTTPTTASLTGFRSGDKNLHFVHVNRSEKGRTCKTCHDVHASDRPRHVADSVPFEGSTFYAMPIGFELTPAGGRCSPGCHEPKSYDRNPSAGATSPAKDRGAP